jgi:ankyrin repeat protein
MSRRNYLLILFFIANIIFAQSNSIFDVARKGSLSDMKLLFEKDKKVVNSTDERGSSMLILACYLGNHEVAKFLIEKGANINYVSLNGTALMASVYKNETDLVDELLKRNANLNLTDNNGQTALMLATQIKNTEIVRKLVNAGANKELKCKQNKTAFEYAVFSNNEEIINLLK